MAEELAGTFSLESEGGLGFAASALFGDLFLEPIVLLETGVEFRNPNSQEPLTLSDTDRTRILQEALEAALKSTKIRISPS